MSGLTYKQKKESYQCFDKLNMTTFLISKRSYSAYQSIDLIFLH